MGNLLFTQQAWEDYLFWQQTDKKLLKRINALLKDIDRGGFEGLGKPEPLKGDLSGFWSRRHRCRTPPGLPPRQGYNRNHLLPWAL